MRRFFLPLVSAALFLVAAATDGLTVLYFFSSNCPSCKNIEPIVKDLSKELKMQGLAYGQSGTESLPFDVRRGDEDTSKRYGIKSFPALVFLMNGNAKQVFHGEHDIEDAKSFLYAFRKGALSVSEALGGGSGKEFVVVGWITSRGNYFKGVKFFLTDRTTNLPIKAWLPLEAIKSPFRKTRPRLMSDVINKPVVLRGELMQRDQAYEFIVKEEVKLKDDGFVQTQKSSPLRQAQGRL